MNIEVRLKTAARQLRSTSSVMYLMYGEDCPIARLLDDAIADIEDVARLHRVRDPSIPHEKP